MAQQPPTFYQHKIKCLSCSLHFIVCSDYEDWPEHGTTREQVIGEATGLIHCPECGSTNKKLHWTQETNGFINDYVPGPTMNLTIT